MGVCGAIWSGDVGVDEVGVSDKEGAGVDGCEGKGDVGAEEKFGKDIDDT